MYRFGLLLIVLPLILSPLELFSVASAAAKDRGGDFDACTKGQAEVAAQAAGFQGAERIKQLIQADITRAKREENEGDADECLEALDHARKLLAGQY